MGATTADYDGDGHLDVFVYQTGDWSERTPVGFRNPGSIGNITDDNGAPNVLLRGNGSGGFEVVEDAGISGERWSLGASFVDFTGDGRPDVHVANDFNRDVLYVNNGDGTFEQRLLGAETDRNGMSSEVGDVNNDSHPDVFVTSIYSGTASADVEGDTDQVFENRDRYAQGGRSEGNNLLVNRGNGTFVDRASEYGVRRTADLWGWAAIMADLDNDGDPDLLHANNERNDATTGGSNVLVSEPTPPAVWAFADGRFVRVDATQAGFGKADGRGMAQLDYDRDGDADVLIADHRGRYRLYENRLGEDRDAGSGGLLSEDDPGRHAIQLLVKGERRYVALGARVQVTVDDRTQHHLVTDGADYLSQDTRVLHVGLGSAETADRVRIEWPDGTTHTLVDVPADQYLRVHPNGTVRATGFEAG
jgi:hypothetical protein